MTNRTDTAARTRARPAAVHHHSCPTMDPESNAVFTDGRSEVGAGRHRRPTLHVATGSAFRLAVAFIEQGGWRRTTNRDERARYRHTAEGAVTAAARFYYFTDKELAGALHWLARSDSRLAAPPPPLTDGGYPWLAGDGWSLRRWADSPNRTAKQVTRLLTDAADRLDEAVPDRFSNALIEARAAAHAHQQAIGRSFALLAPMLNAGADHDDARRAALIQAAAEYGLPESWPDDMEAAE